jgi:uncharacterized protein YlxW (UPF0749 family)
MANRKVTKKTLVETAPATPAARNKMQADRAHAQIDELVRLQAELEAAQERVNDLENAIEDARTELESLIEAL